MIKRSSAFLAALFLALFLSATARAGQFQDGDIIFQTSRSAQSAAIQKATRSRYSHMGIIFLRHGSPYVFEAIKAVRYTPLKTWIGRGEGGHFVVKRLREAGRVLTPGAIAKLCRAAAMFQGKPYDTAFAWSDDRISCSELVWKIYDRALGIRIGRLQKLRDFDLSDRAVKRKLKERYGNHVPLDETVISPAAMFASPDLVLIQEQ